MAIKSSVQSGRELTVRLFGKSLRDDCCCRLIASSTKTTRRGAHRQRSRAVENSCQPVRMFAFAVEGATHCREGLRQRKNVAGDQQIGILGSYRMPIHSLSR